LTDGREAGKNVSPGEVISYFRDDTDQIEDNLAGCPKLLARVVCLGSIVLLSVNVRITLFVFLPLMAIVQKAETRIKQYRRAGRQATQQVTGSSARCLQRCKRFRWQETTVLNQLRQVNERRRQMMVQDKLLTAILNSMFQNMVSIGTGLICF